MNFTTNYKEIKTAWTRLKKLKMKDVSIPILQGVHFEEVKGEVCLNRTNLNQSMSIKIVANLSNADTTGFVIPDKGMEAIIAGKCKSLRFQHTPGSETVWVIAGNGIELEIPVFPEHDYPFTAWHNRGLFASQGKWIGDFEISGKELKSVCASLYPLAKEESRRYHGACGFAIGSENGGCYAIGTNRIAMNKIALPLSFARSEFTMGIDIQGLALLKVAFGAKEAIHVGIISNMVDEDIRHLLVAESYDCRVVVKQANEKFPPWQEIYGNSVVSQDRGIYVGIDTETLLEGLKRQEAVWRAETIGNDYPPGHFYLVVKPERLAIVTHTGKRYSIACNTIREGVIALAWDHIYQVINPSKKDTNLWIHPLEEGNIPDEAMNILQENADNLLMPYSCDDTWKEVVNL